jgi:hypothetical protein
MSYGRSKEQSHLSGKKAEKEEGLEILLEFLGGGFWHERIPLLPRKSIAFGA